jgi:hypothetical protein
VKDAKPPSLFSVFGVMGTEISNLNILVLKAETPGRLGVLKIEIVS